MNLLLLTLSLLMTGALAALLLDERRGTAIAAASAVAGCAIGLVAAFQVLGGAADSAMVLTGGAPFGGIRLGIDALSAFFLVPLFALSALSAVYGRHYLQSYRGRRLGPPAAFFNLLVASMTLVVTARGGLLFLVAWEVMTLSSYLLVTFEHGIAAVRRAGFVYLIAAHVGVVCLITLFLLLERHAQGLDFESFQRMPALSTGTSALVFALALVGFGVKAGLLPLHVWLPEAHAAAPSHVSALMSGVVVNLGLYGLLRVAGFLQPAAWWGPLLMALGLTGGLYGISLASYQRDMKRVLAYSTVENVGIMVLGLGLAFWGHSHGKPQIAALAIAGALLHVWNHTLMKGLLFLTAGSVMHGAGTKDLEKLGGVLKRMPRTGGLMIVGAMAIAGLPPLNGFVGEWLLYLALGRTGVAHQDAEGLLAFLGFGALALIGGIAALCFVRLIGIALLGQARSEKAAKAHESSAWLTAPAGILALGAAFVALAPGRVLGCFSGVVAQVFGPAVAGELGEARRAVAAVGVSQFVIAIVLAALAVALLFARRDPRLDDTWGCGYPAGTPRIQYSARAFAALSERFLPRSLRARVTGGSVSQLFPGAPGPDDRPFSTDGSDPLTRGLYEPFLVRWAGRFSRLRWLQQGVTHVYIIYVLAVVMLAMAWMTARDWMAP